MGNEMVRDRMLDSVGEAVLRLRRRHTVRVCVDGPDAAGKTTFADDLAGRLGAARPVIRLSIDRFHRPEAYRRRRGSLSPEGYYHDSFDYDTVREKVLRPLGPGGDGRYLPGAFDYRTDSAAGDAVRQAAPGSILLFDGVFMLRPELRGCWDLSIYLHVDPEVSLRRALLRDLDLFGSAQEIEKRYLRRYLPGQALYRAEANPGEAADCVINMNAYSEFPGGTSGR
jgi:uridine kinase